MSKATKTEHNGAKIGVGYWGPRARAKQHSKKRRRLISKLLVKLPSDSSLT